VLVNTDVEKENSFIPESSKFEKLKFSNFCLICLADHFLGSRVMERNLDLPSRRAQFIASRRRKKPIGLSGDDLSSRPRPGAWAIQSLSKIVSAESIDGLDWALARGTNRIAPKNFLTARE